MSSGVRDTIKHEDVLRRVYDFCAQHGYTSTLRCLQAESRVPYNILRTCSAADLERCVLEGDWDALLSRHLEGLLFPRQISFALYEQVVDEAVAAGYSAAAKTLFLNSPVFDQMRSVEPTRHQRILQHVQSLANSDSVARAPASAAEQEATMERRRALLSQILTAVEFNAPPAEPDLASCVLRGVRGGLVTVAPPRPASTQHLAESSRDSLLSLAMLTACPQTIARKLTIEPTSTAPGGVEVAAGIRLRKALHDKASGASAAVDVLITVSHNGVLRGWDVSTLSPIAAPASASHSDAALSICIYEHSSCESCFVGIGFRDGTVKVYDMSLSSCSLLRKLPQLHSQGVVSLAFVGDVRRAVVKGGEGGESYRLDPVSCRCLVMTSCFDGSLGIANVFDSRLPPQIVPDAHVSPGAKNNFVVTKLQRFGMSQVLSVGFDGWLRCWDVATVTESKVNRPIDVRSLVRRKLSASHVDLAADDGELVPSELLVVGSNAHSSDTNKLLTCVAFPSHFAAIVDVARGTVRSLILLPDASYRIRSMCASTSRVDDSLADQDGASLLMTTSDGSLHFLAIDCTSLMPLMEPTQRCTSIPACAGVLVDDAVAVCVGPATVAVSSFTQKTVFILEK